MRDHANQPANLYLLVGALLVVAIAAVYWYAPEGAFLVHHDDDDYVTANPHVTGGLRVDNVVWAFSHSHAGNWHPLTWISHQIDVTLFGLDPHGHHSTNVILHALNTLLLLLILVRMTGALWRSGFVAALFAVHPLHVESVAWIAERKDVLSTAFLFLTIWAYVRYTHACGIRRYTLVIALFVLGLLAKPMLVTLPFLLLLLDFWPLGRIAFRNSRRPGSRAIPAATSPPCGVEVGLVRVVLEKIPLIVLSAASCVVTLVVQTRGGAVQDFPLLVKISNAAVAYVHYLFKMIWPVGLSAQYPHPEGAISPWLPVLAALCLFSVTGFVIRLGRRRPYLPVGWFWYIGTLVPVIGIIQVGNQAMADRYTYIPSIGIFVIFAWVASDILRFTSADAAPDKTGKNRSATASARRRAAILALTALTVLVVLGSLARLQVTYWRDSITLFRHALEVNQDNYLAEHDLGMALILSRKVDDGLEHLSRAVAIKPDFGVAWANLAMVWYCLGDVDRARACVASSRQHGCEPPEELMHDLEKSTAAPAPNQ